MPLPYVQRSSTTGAKAPFLCDYSQSPFNMSVAAVLEGAATATYAVQYTLDDLNDASITPVWFDDAKLPTGTAANGVSNYMFPVRAVRINIAAISGTVRFTAIQGTQQP